MLFNFSQLLLCGTTCPFQQHSCASNGVCPGYNLDHALRLRSDQQFQPEDVTVPPCPTTCIRKLVSLANHSFSFSSSHFLPRLSPSHPVLLSPVQKNAAAKNTNRVDCGIETRLGAQTILHGSVRTRIACLTLSLLYRTGALCSPSQASDIRLLNTDVLY